MAIDTVVLRSPDLTNEQVKAIENSCMRRQGFDLATGDIQYELTTASLKGTWDSNVSMQVKREIFVYDGGTPRTVPCTPHLRIEGSVHKAMRGHNVYGGPVDFQESIKWFITDLEKRLSCDLPFYKDWIVRRIDWAEVFILNSSAITQYFRGLRSCTFPRRKVRNYGLETIFCHGSTTTVKIYHKGPEFKVHDYKKLKECAPDEVDNLLDLSYSILRVEVGIQSRKLSADFGKLPTVKDINDSYIKDIHDTEIKKLIRETASEMKIVRDNEAVHSRLTSHYRPSTGRNLFGFWMQMATLGEEVVKSSMPKASFYRHRKQLIDAGVSWNNTDLNIASDNVSVLPKDFKPLRTDPRHCDETLSIVEIREKLQNI